jgi:hypothetical protein
MSVRHYTDPRLMARLARLEERVHPRAYDLESRVMLPRTLLEPEAWGTGFLRVTPREMTYELRSAMEEPTPQALLRDLHRPEFVWRPIDLIQRERVHMPRREPSVLRFERLEPLKRAIEVWVEERNSWLTFVNREWKPHREESPDYGRNAR